MTNPNSTEQATDKPTTATNIRWIYFKLLQVGLAVVLIIVVIGMWHSTSQTTADAFEDHAYKLVRQVVKQARLPVAMSESRTALALKPIIVNLTSSAFIIDATIYSDTGEILAQSDNALPVKQAVGLAIGDDLPNLFTLVETVQQDEQLIGYIRVTFDYDAVQQDSKQFQQDFSGISRLMMLLSAIIGFLFALAFSRPK